MQREERRITMNEIQKAAKLIQEGGIVLFPTETVYGIGANAFDDEAVKKIFIAKGRPQDNPLILHISNTKMLDEIVKEVSTVEKKLIDTFWPGPFTIIFSKKENIASIATCGGTTVGVRMPSNPIAHDLIELAGVPIAAPSANISGKPSGTNLMDIVDELKDKVDGILDGGNTQIGLESTVVRVVNDEVQILRPGKITREEIERVVSKVTIDSHVLGELQNNEKVLSPGMKYRHYAPKTHCKMIFSQDAEKMKQRVLEEAKNYKRVLVLSFEEDFNSFGAYPCINLGSRNNLEQVSHSLFSNLRRIDQYGVDIALIEGVSTDGLGLAIMNRLIRACEHDYEEV